jgi:hypothetical protein
LTDEEQRSEECDSETESSISTSDSDSESSGDDGEEKNIRAYVASIFEQKNKQKSIQPTQEEDIITLPDETLP